MTPMTQQAQVRVQGNTVTVGQTLRPEILILERQYLAECVIGKILYNNVIMCYTLERLWNGNIRQASCIPEGTYPLAIHNSPKFGRSILLRNTAPRSGILIHAGNDVIDDANGVDSLGCILPQTSIEIRNNTIVGVRSKFATDIISNLIFGLIEDGKQVQLKITSIKQPRP